MSDMLEDKEFLHDRKRWFKPPCNAIIPGWKEKLKSPPH